jgi:hypothetical protein
MSQYLQYLQIDKPQAMYDKEIHAFHSELVSEHFSDNPNLFNDFHDSMCHWITASNRNTISGLDAFPRRDFTVGVTQSLDDLHMMHPGKIVIMEDEYRYHQRLFPNITVRTPDTLTAGDILVFSIPFGRWGGMHPQTQDILNKCTELNIPVHIDAAWLGACKNININIDQPCIKTWSVSLSEGFGLGVNRIGMRFSRERINGPVTIMNDFNMNIHVLMWYGIKFIERFGPDFLWNKYEVVYHRALQELELNPSQAIHIMHYQDEQGILHPRGVRKVLRKMIGDLP